MKPANGAGEPVLLVKRERDIVTNSERSALALARLRDHGVRIAIDDFGTGYASFLTLRELRADRLKIDQQFTSNMFESRADELIVTKVIEIAHSLEELKTICRCGRKAIFNARTVGGEFVFDGEQVAIDGVDAGYESLCGACYLEESGGVLNRGWRPKLDFSYRNAPDADFT